MPILGKLIKPVYIYAGKLKTPETDRPNTGHHAGNGNGRPKTDTNGRPPKVYIHSGIIGNAIPGSEKSAETVRS